MLRGLRNFLNRVRPEHHGSDCMKCHVTLIRAGREDRCPGLLRAVREDRCSGLPRAVREDRCPGLLRAGREDRCPGLLRAVREDRCSGLLRAVREDRCPGLLRAVREDRCPGLLRLYQLSQTNIQAAFYFSFSFIFSSRWRRSAWKGPYSLRPVSQQSAQGCPRNSANICLVEHRSFSALEGGMSVASFLHSSFL